MVETLEYLKNNMEFTGLLGSVGMSSLKALLTTIPIIGAFLAVQRFLPGVGVYYQILAAS